MRANEGTLLALTGGLRLKTRVQHPKVIERTDRGGAYWYFRYWQDEVQPDGSLKPVRKFQRLGPSRGENKLTKKQAEIERDKILANLNKATVEEKIVEEGFILFGAMAEKYIHSYVDATAAGRSLLSISTRNQVPQPAQQPHPAATEGRPVVRHPARRGPAVAV